MVVTVRRQVLYVEAEVHDVAVLHHVFLALDRKLACLAHGALASEGHIVVVLYHLGTDKALFEIGVDNACLLYTSPSPRDP